MANKLYTYPENFRAYKAIVAAQYSGQPLEVVKDFKYGETNKNEEFLKKFPLGKTPALETKDGQTLSDANAIAYYLANDKLRGSDEISRAQVLQWVSLSDNELLQPIVTLVFPILKILQVSGEELKRANEDLVRVVNVLNSHLNDRQYLVGDGVTLADLAVATYLVPLLQNVWDNEKLAKHANLAKWFNNLISQKEFAVLGDLKLKQAKKKAEPQQPSTGGDELAGEAPKPKDPFLQYPAGTFDMDAFKREYSNKSEDESSTSGRSSTRTTIRSGTVSTSIHKNSPKYL